MENDIFKAIKERRAIYPEQFNNELVSKDEIQQLIEAARYAPTHKLTEPWRFKAILGNSKNNFASFAEKIIAEHPDFAPKAERMANKIQKSGAILIISFQRDQKERIPEWEEIAATAMAVQNMWLYLQHLNMGGYWSSGKPLMYAAKNFTSFEQGEKILGLFFIGKYDIELKERRHKNVDEFTKWI
ncbi:nitroreductase family protein [Membranihabitans maritimus]|uniref:nitroreductase family protein n=1 Tax=Membranihabitans maritimus TaxID=2904244 RepID=UPI001F34DAE6|nr:nitroreductase [Membranihabitans maritimus]